MDGQAFQSCEQLNFKTIGFFSPLFVFLLMLLAGALFGGVLGAFESNNSQNIVYAITIGCAMVIGMFLLRYFTWRKVAAPMQFNTNSLIVPRRQNAKRCDEIPYHSIKSVDIRGKGKHQVLLIASEKRNYLFRLTTFKESRERIEAMFSSAISHSEQGAALWQSLQQNQKNAQTLLAKKSHASLILTLVIAAIFLLSWWFSGSNSLQLVYLGANVPTLVDAGQWGRLFTANFLHANWLHIYLNAFNLFILGAVLEKLLGWQKFLSIYLLSCLGGAFVSYLSGIALMSVGASSGIFGLLGSLLYINYKMGFRLPAGFNFGTRTWLIILGINGALPFLIPQIDWAAHLGGFVTGLAVTYLLLHNTLNKGLKIETLLELWPKASLKVNTLTTALSLLFILAIIQRLSLYPQRHQDLPLITDALITSFKKSADDSNNFAWSVVQNKQSTSEELALANEVMTELIDSFRTNNRDLSDETKGEFLDTYASVKFLQGAYDEAVNAEYQAISFNPKSYFYSQFSRFLYARVAASGPLIEGKVKAEQFTLNTQNSVADEKPAIVYHSTQTSPFPTAVLVHVLTEKQRLGYFICHFVAADKLVLSDTTGVLPDATRPLNYSIDAVHAKWLIKSASDTCEFFQVDGINGIVSDSMF